MTMLEKIVEAIAGTGVLEDAGWSRESAQVIARAALMAIREPEDAFIETFRFQASLDDFGLPYVDDVAWTIGVDAILNEAADE